MIPAASTTAWALHDLGLAASLGGNLYGRMAMHPAVRAVSDPRERGELVHDAWHRFNRLNLLSHVLFATTWVVGRRMLSGRAIDRRTRIMVGIKDALVATSLVSGVTSIIAGERGMRDPNTGRPAPMDESGNVEEWQSGRAKKAERVTKGAGIFNLLALAGIVGLTAALAMKAGSSSRWVLISRRLP
jgi:hypothetical protein